MNYWTYNGNNLMFINNYPFLGSGRSAVRTNVGTVQAMSHVSATLA